MGLPSGGAGQKELSAGRIGSGLLQGRVSLGRAFCSRQELFFRT